MASRDFLPVRGTLDHEVVVLAGSFLPNGSSAIVNGSNTGNGFTVAWTSTGLYTVTLADKYNSLLGANLELALSTPADQVLQLGTVDVASAKTIQITAWDISGAAVADIASNAANRIYFVFHLKNSSLP